MTIPHPSQSQEQMHLYLFSIGNLKQVDDIFDRKCKGISVMPSTLPDALGFLKSYM